MNELEKKHKRTESAFLSARDAIVKRLGGNPSDDEVLAVVQLLTHHLLTGGCTHPISISMHNLAFFNRELTDLIESTQKDIDSTTCGLLS